MGVLCKNFQRSIQAKNSHAAAQLESLKKRPKHLLQKKYFSTLPKTHPTLIQYKLTLNLFYPTFIYKVVKLRLLKRVQISTAVTLRVLQRTKSEAREAIDEQGEVVYDLRTSNRVYSYLHQCVFKSSSRGYVSHRRSLLSLLSDVLLRRW